MLLAEFKIAISQQSKEIERYLDIIDNETNTINDDKEIDEEEKEEKEIKENDSNKDKSKINQIEKPSVILTLDNCLTYLQNLDDYKPYSSEFYELFIDLSLLRIYIIIIYI